MGAAPILFLGVVLEWFDYADCAGDDPDKWDLDCVDVVDVQAYARSACGDCPVRRECAAHAIDDRIENSRIFNAVVEDANVGAAIPDRVEPEGESTIAQTGVIRGGVALVEGSVRLLYAAAGREWSGCHECSSCGRLLYRDGVPREKRPAGSVQHAARGMCSSCAYGTGRASLGRNGGVSTNKLARAHEAKRLRDSGLSVALVADRLGVGPGTVWRYLKLVKDD